MANETEGNRIDVQGGQHTTERANPVLEAIKKAQFEIGEGVVTAVEIDLDSVRPIDELDVEFSKLVQLRDM